MQWFKSAMVISTVLGVAALSANGCSSNKNNGDGGTGDGGGDVIIGKDTGTKDSGGDTGNGGCSTAPVSCEQCDVSGYTVAQMGKPTDVINACNATQLQAFVTACFSSGASTATCSAWAKQDGGACSTCLNPVLQTAANWGPFDCATSSSPCGANSGGCVDLVLGSTAIAAEKNNNGAGSCGDAINAAFGCEDFACTGCTVTADFTACVKDAVGTGATHQCKTYTDVQDSTTGACAVVNSDAAPAALTNCFPQTDADNVNFVNVFCGTGP
jgi:hypothetical protein